MKQTLAQSEVSTSTLELALLTGHVRCHVAFSGKQPLFEELVTDFGGIIQQKRVLDAGQLFPSSHLWNDRPSFRRKIL